MNLSTNFTLEELLRSDIATRRGFTEQFNPPQVIIDNITSLCTNILEPLRELLKKPIYITSGYRCQKTNTAIGGAWDSQHTRGQAADTHTDSMTTEELFKFVKASNLKYDQLIQEFDTWVHISYNPNLKVQRKQCLRAVLQSGTTVYIPA